MTEINPKNGFWQFPLSLKLTVFWIFIDRLNRFLTMINKYIANSHIELGNFVTGVVFFSLAVGLIEKRNSSRIWASVWVICGTLIRFYLLWRVILYGVGPEANFTFLSAKYPITNVQAILFLIFNIIFNIGVVYILLRPSTKALFSSQSVLSPEPTP